MAALGAAICNALTGGWKRNIGILALWGLTTVARQPGAIAASALKPSHIVRPALCISQIVTFILAFISNNSRFRVFDAK